MSLTIFPRTNFVRLSSILAPIGPIPVSRSTWWQGARDTRGPFRVIRLQFDKLRQTSGVVPVQRLKQR